jgi:hypothetical protein
MVLPALSFSSIRRGPLWFYSIQKPQSKFVSDGRAGCKFREAWSGWATMIALVAVSGKFFFTRALALNNGNWHQRIVILGVVDSADAGTCPLVDVLHELVVSH